MNVLVYGAGGIGLYLAARLARSGTAVTLKGRGSALTADRSSPLTLVHGGAAEEVHGVEIVEDIDGRRFDAAIVATKAWQVPAAAQEITPTLGAEGVLLTTQNGVDAPHHAQQHMPRARVLAGTVVVIAQRIGTLTVELVGPEATITAGNLDEPSLSPAASRLLEQLRSAGIEAAWSPDIRTALWKKLALIASYGGVGALSDSSVGRTRIVPRTRELVRHAVDEAVAVGNRAGARLTAQDVADVMDIYDRRFSPETTASLQRDLASGLPSELHDQSGAVVAHGARLGVPTPIHETIYASLLPRELAARERHRPPQER